MLAGKKVGNLADVIAAGSNNQSGVCYLLVDQLHLSDDAFSASYCLLDTSTTSMSPCARFRYPG